MFVMRVTVMMSVFNRVSVVNFLMSSEIRCGCWISRLCSMLLE